MKRNFLLLITLCMSLYSVAQEKEHLKFMGEPLKGSLSEFIERFSTNHPNIFPYDIDENNDSIYQFKGQFYKFNDCYIKVSINRKAFNMVTSGMVTIGGITSQEDKLLSLIGDLNEKYGGCEILERMDDWHYKLRWTCDEGIIDMSVKGIYNTCELKYVDYVEAIDIIKNELEQKIKKLEKEQKEKLDL